MQGYFKEVPNVVPTRKWLLLRVSFKMKLCLYDSNKNGGKTRHTLTDYEKSTFKKGCLKHFFSNQDFVLSGYYSF